MFIFLIVAAGLFVVLAARESKKLRKALASKRTKIALLPKTISLFVICVQVSELLKTLDHINITSFVATVFLLTILVASKSGIEDELF